MDRLSEQIHLLGDMLGDTIIEQEGEPLFERVEEIRAFAKAHRKGDADAGAKLLALVEGLPLETARGVVKAFATYFQLVNLAEEEERVRILQQRRADAAAQGQAGRRRDARGTPPVRSTLLPPGRSAGRQAQRARHGTDRRTVQDRSGRPAACPSPVPGRK